MKNHFGLFMRQLRQAQGHTQESLARTIGCEPRFVDMVERNVTPPRGRIMIPWCNEIRFPFEQMVFLYAKEQMKMMYVDAGIPWDPESDNIAASVFTNNVGG